MFGLGYNGDLCVRRVDIYPAFVQSLLYFLFSSAIDVFEAVNPRSALIIALLTVETVATGQASGQVLTHGPVVGGVTGSEAKVFVRTDQAGSVALRYGTD